MGLVAIIALKLAAAILVTAFVRAPRLRRLGAVGWFGVAVFCVCGAWLGTPFAKPAGLVAAAWTGYVVAIDAAVYCVRGHSLIRSSPNAFLWLAVLSVFLWLPFEWYNLRLAAWYRSGLPDSPLRYVLLGWSSACIWPALYETADFFLALASRRKPAKPRRAAPSSAAVIALAVGVACLTVPVALPRLDAGEFLMPLIACGFLLVLDPVNRWRGWPGLWSDWSALYRHRIAALALSGAFCGLLADCLNAGASAKWHAIYAGAGLKIFELPLVALMVLPVFALQAYVLHGSVAGVLGLPISVVPSTAEPHSPRASGSTLSLR